MKTKSILFSIILGATALALFHNCSGNKKEESQAHDAYAPGDSTIDASASSPIPEASKPQFAVDAAFQQQLADIFTAYVSLKDAFVSSDVNKVKEEVVTTKQAITKADMKLLSGAAHNDWMGYLEGMQTSLKEMEVTADIEVQREAFSKLSENLYKSIKAYGLGGATAYYEFCPMAFNNQGGFWISDEEKIRNPYFGDEMLTCGEVREILK